MELKSIEQNAQVLTAELNWLSAVIDARFKLYFEQVESESVLDPAPPDLGNDDSVYASVIRQFKFGFEERLILILALAPHLRPQILDVFFIKNQNFDRGFTEFGGIKGVDFSGFIPTGETAAFLLAGNEIWSRIMISQIFEKQHFFSRFNILKLVSSNSNEPFLSGALQVSKEYIQLLTTGESNVSDDGFLAKKITTQLAFEDLIVDETVMNGLKEISNWIKHSQTLMHDWQMSKQIKPGYRTLFYGAPGTGKTLAACLLGKMNALDVYRIDLSMVVSKYIGETEKNLAHIFDEAANKNWILYFDEADAILGKRTNISDAHDRYANQEVAYLLQRIEDYPGIVILATNLKANIDECFRAKMQSLVYFGIPDAALRKKLWTNSFSKTARFETSIDFDLIAANHELTGGAIMNIVRAVSIKTIADGTNLIKESDLLQAIKDAVR